MKTYTPGPWYYTASSPDGMVYAEGTHEVIVPTFPDHCTEATWANMRLISAAPELLEACMDTLTRLEWWSHDPTNRSLDNAFAVLKAAIAKATGGEK